MTNWCPDPQSGPSSVTSVSNNLRGRAPAWPTGNSRSEQPTIRRSRTSTRPSSWRTRRHLAQLRALIRSRRRLRMQRRRPCLAISLRCRRRRFLRPRAVASAPSHRRTLRLLHRSPPTPPPAQGQRPPVTTGRPARHPSNSPRPQVFIAAPPRRSRHTASRRQAQCRHQLDTASRHLEPFRRPTANPRRPTASQRRDRCPRHRDMASPCRRTNTTPMGPDNPRKARLKWPTLFCPKATRSSPAL